MCVARSWRNVRRQTGTRKIATIPKRQEPRGNGRSGGGLAPGTGTSQLQHSPSRPESKHHIPRRRPRQLRPPRRRPGPQKGPTSAAAGRHKGPELHSEEP